MTNDMKLVSAISVYTIFFLVAFIFSACSSSKDNSLYAGSKKVISGSPGPGWVWVPEYYIYDGNKYRFVRGHHRMVLSRKAYWKKTLHGYSSGKYYTQAR